MFCIGEQKTTGKKVWVGEGSVVRPHCELLISSLLTGSGEISSIEALLSGIFMILSFH